MKKTIAASLLAFLAACGHAEPAPSGLWMTDPFASNHATTLITRARLIEPGPYIPFAEGQPMTAHTIATYRAAVASHGDSHRAALAISQRRQHAKLMCSYAIRGITPPEFFHLDHEGRIQAINECHFWMNPANYPKGAYAQ